MARIALPLAVAGGTWIFVAVIVALFFIFAFGYYTRSGSGISQRPYRRPDAPPETPSELAHDTTQNLRDWQRGTEGHHRARAREDEDFTDPSVAQALAEWRSGSASISARRLDPPVGPSEPVRGPDEAPTVVVWIDISNESCRSAYRLLAGLADAGQLRLAVRQLPLADVRPLSLAAAEALEAAAAQGSFFPLLDDLTASPLRDENELIDRAAGHVPDPSRLREEVRTGYHRASVIRQIRQATASGSSAVPDVYIGETHYDRPIRRDELVRALRS